ncbi:hypothetical protein Dsin_012653, partial [Dipteronia sinensis]
FEFKATNNEAKYEALLAEIKAAIELEADYLQIKSDSLLVVNQMTGVYQAKGDHKFKGFKIDQVSRHQNHRADVLAKIAANGGQSLPRGIPLQVISQPSIATNKEIFSLDRQPCWMDPIVAYLLEGELPEEPDQARRIKRLSVRYCL